MFAFSENLEVIQNDVHWVIFVIHVVDNVPCFQLPKNKILDWSKVKQIADDILKCI